MSLCVCGINLFVCLLQCVCLYLYSCSSLGKAGNTRPLIRTGQWSIGVSWWVTVSTKPSNREASAKFTAVWTGLLPNMKVTPGCFSRLQACCAFNYGTCWQVRICTEKDDNIIPCWWRKVYFWFNFNLFMHSRGNYELIELMHTTYLWLFPDMRLWLVVSSFLHGLTFNVLLMYF